MPEGAVRWRKGSAQRRAARKLAEQEGKCTTCFGKGGWFRKIRIVHLQTPTNGQRSSFERQWVVCTNCGGDGRKSKAPVPRITPPKGAA